MKHDDIVALRTLSHRCLCPSRLAPEGDSSCDDAAYWSAIQSARMRMVVEGLTEAAADLHRATGNETVSLCSEVKSMIQTLICVVFT